MEIEIHGAIEREIFYPALMEAVEKTSPEIRTEIGQAEAAHDFLEVTARELRNLKFLSDDFHTRWGEFVDGIQVHFDQEEQLLLPAAENVIEPEQLEELAIQLLDRREQLLKFPEYKSAQAGLVQNPNGG